MIKIFKNMALFVLALLCVTSITQTYVVSSFYYEFKDGTQILLLGDQHFDDGAEHGKMLANKMQKWQDTGVLWLIEDRKDITQDHYYPNYPECYRTAFESIATWNSLQYVRLCRRQEIRNNVWGWDLRREIKYIKDMLDLIDNKKQVNESYCIQDLDQLSQNIQDPLEQSILQQCIAQVKNAMMNSKYGAVGAWLADAYLVYHFLLAKQQGYKRIVVYAGAAHTYALRRILDNSALYDGRLLAKPELNKTERLSGLDFLNKEQSGSTLSSCIAEWMINNVKVSNESQRKILQDELSTLHALQEGRCMGYTQKQVSPKGKLFVKIPDSDLQYILENVFLEIPSIKQQQAERNEKEVLPQPEQKKESHEKLYAGWKRNAIFVTSAVALTACAYFAYRYFTKSTKQI